MKSIAALTLLLQIALVGFAAYVIAGGFGPPSPLSVATQTTCTLINLVGGFFNLCTLLR